MGTANLGPAGGFLSRDEALTFAKLLENAVNTHDTSTLVSFYADDAVLVSPVFHQVSGREAIAQNWEIIFSTYPDWSVRVADVMLEGNRLAMIGTATATDHKGWFGLPPTGGVISYRAVILLTFVDGKIIRDERLYDNSAVLEHLEKIRLDSELHTAAEVQRSLLPRAARSGSYYDIAGDSVASRTIGGDFFEFAELSSGGVGVALGDVAGKGPAAALLAAMLQGMLAFEAQAGHGPAETLARMNRAVAERGLGWRLATLAYGILLPHGRFAYSNAGHHAPVLLRGSDVLRLTSGGPILGAVADAQYPEETLHLKRGDSIIMFSDGITESRNAEEEEFGEKRLVDCAKTHCGEPSAQIANGLLAAAREYSQSKAQIDDMTVAVLSYL
ncbi:MAG TPA: SpoIIE family protein phosphatase [Candidatus Acidoferrales bacterium]|nr:SpoIIE family protein phosphatase [Candidatus Acidoferrales bacterium]